jgi:hypothetical protein
MLRNAVGKVAARDGMVAIPATTGLSPIGTGERARKWYHSVLHFLAREDRRESIQPEPRSSKSDAANAVAYKMHLAPPNGAKVGCGMDHTLEQET